MINDARVSMRCVSPLAEAQALHLSSFFMWHFPTHSSFFEAEVRGVAFSAFYHNSFVLVSALKCL